VKRAILVTTGTVAGLVSVLTYSSGDVPGAIVADPAGGGSGGAGLGAPAAEVGAPSTAPSAPGTPPPAAVAAKKAAPAKAVPTPAAAKPAAPATTKVAVPAPTKAAPPAPAPTKAAPAAPKPAPTKTTAPSVAKDFTGASITHKYGTVQVGIRVKGGKLIDAWAVRFPTGDSLPYSEMAIPILRSQTISAKSANIGGATGASFTTNAWIKSLASALSKAGL